MKIYVEKMKGNNIHEQKLQEVISWI